MANSAMPAATPAITPAQQLDERFTAAYTRYQPMVRATIYGQLGLYGPVDTHLVEDLTQNTFLRLYTYSDRIDFGGRVAGLLRLMARQSIGHHFAVMRNTHERPADTGHWTFANRQTAATGSGYYVPAATGFRTAALTNGGAR